MLKISNTKGSIYKATLKNNMVTASMQTGKKNQDGTWSNMWWNVRFVGVNKKDILDFDKARIIIDSAIAENNEYNGKIYTNIIIFEYRVEEGTKKTDCSNDEQGEDELPF